MGAERGGATALQTEAHARKVYGMLETARVGLGALNTMLESDRRREGNLRPAEVHNFLEESGILHSSVVFLTAKALLEIFEALGENE